MRASATAVAIAILGALGLVAMEALEGANGSDRRARETIERGSGLAGTLVAKPDTTRPGKRIGVAVRNVGDRRMTYGLGFELQRRIGEEWRDVRDPFTTEGVPDIALTARPGTTAGPRYSRVLVDRFRLRASVEPGKYRARKTVRGGLRGADLRLKSRFRVTRDK